jgi:hypothetical protein
VIYGEKTLGCKTLGRTTKEGETGEKLGKLGGNWGENCGETGVQLGSVCTSGLKDSGCGVRRNRVQDIGHGIKV